MCDAAIFALGYGLGLRRAEIAHAELKDYNRERDTLSVRYGKGNKRRTLPIDDGARDALDDWLAVRGGDPGALF